MFDHLLLSSANFGEGVELGLQFREAGFAGGFIVQFSGDLVEATIEVFDVALDGAAAFCCVSSVGFPGFEAEDAAEDTFAVGGALLGELVGFALEEEGGVDEGVVVEAEGFLDAGLGFAEGPFSQWLPLDRGRGTGDGVGRSSVFGLRSSLRDLKFQHSALPLRVGSLDTVAVALVFEFEGDLGLFDVGMGVDKAFVGFPGAAEEGVGDGVEQAGFARAVGSGDAGEVEGGEVNSDGGAVGEEAAEGEGAKNHRGNYIQCSVIGGRYSVFRFPTGQ